MTRQLEERIAATAARQHGVISRGQLFEAGLSAGAVSRRLRAGRLRQLHRGVYLVGPVMPARAREMAAVLASGPDAVVSHRSAAVVWGLCSDRDHGDPVDISIAGGNRGRRPGIHLHRVVVLELSDRTVRDRLPLTTPERTLADLAGVVGSGELERAVARAERDGLVDRESLEALLVRLRGRAGIPALRAVLRADKGPALTRSEAESRFLAVVREARLPVPELNVSVGRYEIDFLWRDEGLAVEVDGFRHHSSRPRFEGDRRKDAWLMARGIKVVRLSWRQISDDRMATAVQVGQALARAGSAAGVRTAPGGDAALMSRPRQTEPLRVDPRS